MDAVISIEGLSKKFIIGGERRATLRESLVQILHKSESNKQAFWALKDIYLNIDRGEAIGIIGRNGAGKSTLLKILSQITYPTHGKVTMDGRVSSLLEVGTGFHPELTGRENIYLNGTILGMSRREVKSKFDEIVAFSGVAQFIDTPVKHYSSGMYVRLAFSVAAHLEPEILIIDEVLAVGDAEFQQKCLGKMGDVVNEGRTVLFVSHNMNAVSTLCNRIAIISEGELVYNSHNVQEGINNYLNPNKESDFEDTTTVHCRLSSDIHSLNEVSLVDRSNTFFRGVVHNSNATKLLIRGEILEVDPALNIGFVLYNEKNEEICTSWLNQEGTSKGTFVKGPFLCEVEFPPYFFGRNNYSIEIISVLHNIRRLIRPGEGPRINFKMSGDFKSMINPSFKWIANNL